MAKYAPTGKTELFWVTTISNTAAPTAAELNAGVDLSTFVRNMPDIPRTLNLVDVATIDSKFEKRQVGTRGGDQITLEILRDDSADTAYTTLAEDTVGYLVLGRKGIATAGTWAASDEADVFTCTVGSVADGTPGRNDPDHAIVSMVVTADPNRGVTVAS